MTMILNRGLNKIYYNLINNIRKKSTNKESSTNLKEKVSKTIFNILKENNIKDVHLYSGGAIMPLVNELYNQKDINYYIHTHEQSCGHAATAYARITGKTGVVITTSGPGLTNCITPMLDAQNDSTPLLVISGQVSIKAMNTGAFQEAPSTEITKPFTKWSYLMNRSDNIYNVLNKALYITQNKKKGVVHLDLPKDIAISDTIPDIKNKLSYKLLKPNNEITLNNDEILIKNIYNKIKKSKRPILYIGQGANECKYELQILIKLLNIPFTTTIHAMGIINENHPNSLKFLGMHGSPVANIAMQNADCIIALGSRFDDRTTGNLNGFAKKAIKNEGIIHINIEKSEINKIIKSNYYYNDDCKIFLNKLIACDIKSNKTNENKTHLHWINNINRNYRITEHSPSIINQKEWEMTSLQSKKKEVINIEWINYIKELKKLYNFDYKKDNKTRVQYVLECLNDIIKDKNFIITTGVGNHQMHAAQYITWKEPKTFITSGSLGVMGFGLPAAIGAKIAEPKKLVIDIDGDSSFLMTSSELKTIKEYNLDIKILIINNASQAMVKSWEKIFYNNRIVATENKHNPSFIKMAESFGIDYIACDKKEDIKNTLKKFINNKDAILCEMKVEYDYCLPLIPPGKNLDEMILYNNN